MTPSLKQKILERAAFNEHDSYYRLGYDSEKEPHVKEMIIAARAENARLLPVVTELLELVERQQATLNDMAKAEVKSNLIGITPIKPKDTPEQFIKDWLKTFGLFIPEVWSERAKRLVEGK